MKRNSIKATEEHKHPEEHQHTLVLCSIPMFRDETTGLIGQLNKIHIFTRSETPGKSQKQK